MAEIERRALRVRAVHAADHTRSLALRDRSWRSEVHPVAGGWLVLAGAGMYVNRALAAGIDEELTPADLDLVRARSTALGIVPTIEVTSLTLPRSVRAISKRGYVHDHDADVTCLTRTIPPTPIEASDRVVIHRVESREDLRSWQATSAAGWGHTAPDARRTSDAFAEAAHALHHEHLFVAFDSTDGRPLGCASMTVRDGVAVLGGMSTLPAERRRGVQAALLGYRFAEAGRRGCDLAVTTTARGSNSERNLRRYGFQPVTTIERFRLPTTV